MAKLSTGPMQTSLQRWQQLCQSLDLRGREDEYRRIVAAYHEKHRAYHTLNHISDCLGLLDEALNSGSLKLWSRFIVTLSRAKRGRYI